MDPLSFIALATLLGAMSSRGGQLPPEDPERQRRVAEINRAWMDWSGIVNPERAQVLRDLVLQEGPPGPRTLDDVLPPGWRWERSGPQALLTAVETTGLEQLVGVEIHPMTPLQLQAWEERKELLCPHGTNEVILVQNRPEYWHMATEVTGSPTIGLEGGDSGELLGPEWLECSHTSLTPEGNERSPWGAMPTSWWPPLDLQTEFA